MVTAKRVLGVFIILALLASSATFFTNSWPAAAEDDKFQLAPINPEALEPASPYGYRPPIMDLSHLEGISAQEAMALLAQQPSSWDWRDYSKVTPVKDQNPCGTCWIFGTTSVLESAVLLGESAEYDFSEQSVALCVDRSWVYLYDDADEPCGTVPGHGSGDSFMASEVFIKKGTVLESCNPYDTDGLQCNGTCACDSCPPVKKVTGYRYVTYDGSQTALIKAAVYDRPVTMSFYYDPTAVYSDGTYGTIYDYYPCLEDPNHLVSIIGWNDSVPHPDLDHSGTGAWLVKNSWGTGWENSGYFWLAYDSSSMCHIAYLEYEDYNANETLYYWDEAGWVVNAGYEDTSAWMASVFTSGQDGELTHVDFWTVDSNAAYEIYVYDGFFGSQLASKTGSCAELGYYSIPLTTPVTVTNGQQFTVAVKMTTPGYEYPLPVEVELSKLGYPDICEPPIQEGVSFIRHLDGDSWDDAADFAGIGSNFCLRARITTPAEPPAVTTDAATDVTTESATLNGSLDSLGDYTTVDVSFEWGTTLGGPYPNETTPPEAMTSTGAFSANLSSLSSDTTYYFRAKATGSVTVYGDELSFTTLPSPPLMYIDLSSGWNTFSTPIALDPDSGTWDDLLALSGLDDDVEVVYDYDVSTQYWGLVTTGDAVLPLDGFYVKLSDESLGGTVPIISNPGATPPPSKDLATGLNLIGPAPASLVDEDVIFNLVTIYEAEGGLLGYSMVISPPIHTPNNWVYMRGDPDPPLMEIGNAYWVTMENPDTLWGSSSTPIP